MNLAVNECEVSNLSKEWLPWILTEAIESNDLGKTPKCITSLIKTIVNTIVL